MALNRSKKTEQVQEEVKDETQDLRAQEEATQAELLQEPVGEPVGEPVSMKEPEPEPEPEKEKVEVKEPKGVSGPAGKAVATKPAAAPPVLARGGFVSALEELKQDEDGTVFEFGILPRVKAESGEIMDGDDESLGSFIDVEVMSFNSRWVISPNDNDAPKEVVKYSLNGDVLDDGSGITVKEYLAELKEDWPKADVREYYEVNGILHNSENTTEFLDSLIQIQCSPTTRKSFESHRVQLAMKLRMNKISLDDARFMRFTATKKKSNDGKAYTMMKVGGIPA